MKPQQPTVVFFCTPETGHFQQLRALITWVARSGMSTYVFTHRSFQHQVERSGGTFVDLFGKYPIDEADDESRPIPCRYVSFAGHFADQVIEDIRALNPSLIISETFSVIGPVVAKALDVPHVNVCVGHNMNPARFMAALQKDERVAISRQCHRAVAKLDEVFHLPNASPFSYISSLSALLNVYCEPPEFLDVDDRAAFEPLAFFGCLPDTLPVAQGPSDVESHFGQEFPVALRVYVSFGTVIWKYFAGEATAALKVISRACAEMKDVRAVISLGGAAIDRDVVAALENAHVRVIPYVDQARMLRQADLFVTHHGLNSTHEAIVNGVAMLSCPFFSDQPALARKCQELGVAIPLTESLPAELKVSDVETAFSRFRRNRLVFQSNLDKARGWERNTIRQRHQVMQRIKELIQPRIGACAPTSDGITVQAQLR